MSKQLIPHYLKTSLSKRYLFVLSFYILSVVMGFTKIRSIVTLFPMRRDGRLIWQKPSRGYNRSKLSVSRNLVDLYKWMECNSNNFNIMTGVVVKNSDVSGLGIFNEKGETISKGSIIMIMEKDAWYPYCSDFALSMQQKENADILKIISSVNPDSAFKQRICALYAPTNELCFKTSR